MKILASVILIVIMFTGMLPAKKGFVPQTIWIVLNGGFQNLGNIQTTYSMVPGDSLRFTAGTATGWFIQNSRFADSVYIKGSDSGSYFNGNCETNNCKSLVIINIKGHDLGNGTRWMDFEANCDSITVRNCRIDRSVDYQVQLHASSLTNFDNFIFVNDTFRGCGFANVINTSAAKMRNLQVYNCIFDSTYSASGAPAACISITDPAPNYSIHDNRYTHINLGGVDHTSVNYLAGSGSFYNNYCFDRQGDFVRFRPYWVDSSASSPTRTVTYCYNNRDVSARKYATFELQQFSTDTNTNTTVPNVKTGKFVGFNNTSGNGRTADYTPWTNAGGGGSGMWDIYTMYQNDTLYNNIGFRYYIDSVPNPNNPPPAFTFNYMFHDGGGSRPAWYTGRFGDTSNNLYFNVPVTLSANWGGNDSLIMNLVNTSPARGYATARSFYLSSTGYRGNSRRPNPDAGADQFNTWFWTPVKWRRIKTVN